MNPLSLRFRKVRRATVAAHYLSFALATFFVSLHSRRDPILWTILSLAVLYVFTTICLFVVTAPYGVSGIRWKPGPDIDERQRRVRADALAYSYWITSVVIVLVCLWSGAAIYINSLWRPRDISEWMWLLWCVVMVTSVLPPVIIAWNEPDMPTETFDSSSAAGLPVSR